MSVKNEKNGTGTENGERHELVLDGLCCTTCQSRIEEGISGLPDSRKIITEIEPEIIVKEKMVDKGGRKMYMLLGLCCAECALAIEEKIRSIPGVTRAKIDFGKKQLFVDLVDEDRTRLIEKEAREKAASVVRGIRLRDKEKKRDLLRKARLALFAIGTGVLLSAMIFQPPAEIALWFYIVAYALAGGDVLWKAIRNMGRGRIFDENFLMSIATAGAFAVGEFPEAVSVMVFYKIGQSLEDLAVNRSRKRISSILQLRPLWAMKKHGDKLVRIAPEEIRKGDEILVRPGERIPLDGIITEGMAFLDQSALTGESVPVKKKIGDEVSSGSLVKNSVIVIKVTKTLGDSTITRIMDFVGKAHEKKAKAEHFITKFARVYTPAVVAAAVLVAFIPPLLFSGQELSEWVYRALIFLVISCPCALVLSIPMTFFSGIGSLARNGILVKGSQYIEALSRVKSVFFDKTGTLTKGLFGVREVMPAADFTRESVLEYAAAVEAYSSHPIATAIKLAYGNPPDPNRLGTYDEIAGRGISAVYDGRNILLGNRDLLDQKHVASGPVPDHGTSVLLAVDGVYAGYLLLADEVRPDAAKALSELKILGVDNLVMLTGDRPEYARQVAGSLGITEVRAGLLPEAKVIAFEELMAKLHRTGTSLFLGDGINDAPLLARADVGAAMGGLGSDAAVETADLVLMNDSLQKLPLAVRLSKKTHRIVMQNVVLAFGMKAVILGLGLLGFVSMWAAVFADVGVALLALFNALRVMRQGKAG